MLTEYPETRLLAAKLRRRMAPRKHPVHDGCVQFTIILRHAQWIPEARPLLDQDAGHRAASYRRRYSSCSSNSRILIPLCDRNLVRPCVAALNCTRCTPRAVQGLRVGSFTQTCYLLNYCQLLEPSATVSRRPTSSTWPDEVGGSRSTAHSACLCFRPLLTLGREPFWGTQCILACHGVQTS